MIKTISKAAIAILLSSAIPIEVYSQENSVEEFYSGKTISVVIGYPPGGGFDTAARLLVRHMPRHIPGNPDMVPINMPGAGSLLAANHLFNNAKKDGTEFGVMGGSIPFSAIWNDEGIYFDATEFNWLGSMDRWTGIALIRADSSVQTIEDAMKEEVTVGATGAGDVTSIYPKVLNALVGTQFNIVAGYSGTADLNLAMEQGEIDGRLGWDWDGVKMTNPGWIADGFAKPILQLSSSPHAELADVPLAFDLAKSEEDKQIMRLVFGSEVMARPFVAPPGVPDDRLAALREAFEATMVDPEFLEEAARSHIPVKPTFWTEMSELIDAAYKTPQNVVERAAAIITKP